MNTAIILAAGIGQRMRNGGLPKQFLRLSGKPIVVYTLEKVTANEQINQVVIVCHGSYVELMESVIQEFHVPKVAGIVVGGSDRQSSVQNGLKKVEELGAKDDDLVMIHDGVRPLLSQTTIEENLRIASEYGCAMTVHPVTETVVVTEEEKADANAFQKRSATYSLTSPQTFRLSIIRDAYLREKTEQNDAKPLLDAAMVYADQGNDVYLVKEQGANLKITTPEDFYIFRALLELEENRHVFGL